MQDNLKKDFRIEKPTKDAATFEAINGIVSKYFALMGALGQSMYNLQGAEESYEKGKGLEYQLPYTRACFEADPIRFLTNGEGTIFSKSSQEIVPWTGTQAEAEYHDTLHHLLKNGVGMKIPAFAQVILLPEQTYPVMFFKQNMGEQVSYGVGDRLPQLNDDDNIYVIQEESFQMTVHQLFKPESDNDYYVSQGVKTGKLKQAMAKQVKAAQAKLNATTSYGSTGESIAEAEPQMGHKVKASFESDNAQAPYINVDFYDPAKGGEGRIIITMPYPIAQLDVLGVVQMQGNSVASEIVLTTTT
jgi:hypothetical protein